MRETLFAVASVCALGVHCLTLDLQAAAGTGPVKIGAIFSVTGPASFLGAPEEKTVRMFVDKLNAAGGVNGQPIYFDAAEPKSIDELRHEGIAAVPCDKGPDSVRSGIDFLKSKHIHIVEGSSNIYKEMSGYCWRKDKSGNPLPEPVKFDDHLMDAIRYGIFTRCARPAPMVWRV